MLLKQQAMPPVARHYLVSYYCQSLFLLSFTFWVFVRSLSVLKSTARW
jgi:hypothetical protein